MREMAAGNESMAPPKKGSDDLPGFATARELTEKSEDNQKMACNANESGAAAKSDPSKQKPIVSERGIEQMCGFSTARDHLNDTNFKAAPAGLPMKRSSGFSTAKEYVEGGACDQGGGLYAPNAGGNVGAQKSDPTSSRSTKFEGIPSNQNSFAVLLTVRGIKYHKENLESLDIITLEREPENVYDANAICAKNGVGNIVGHVAKEQAAVLAQPLDDGTVGVVNIALKEQRDAVLVLTANVNLLDAEKREQFCFEIYRNMTGVQSNLSVQKKVRDKITDEAVLQLAQGITAQDAETASTCRIDVLKATQLPWKTNADGSVAAWPPSQDFLDELGYGGADDEAWWQDNAGLKPPSTWNLTGALDLLPKLSLPSHQKSKARDVLDDAVHGVTNVWTDATLAGIRDIMHSENFWSFRGGDAFIRAFGGPYVLGQKEGKLKLIKGAPHTSLTEKICRGHNLVYELIHAEKPPAPGFNTLIYGLNLRRSGFHYHQDTIASLKAKNAPLVGRQPVVTTVYYEKPETDNGKELVLWKPMMNFKPRDDSLYAAARGVQTLHGMVHVQKAGLQSKAQHGIFHAPVFAEGKTCAQTLDGTTRLEREVYESEFTCVDSKIN
ncbi:hypothetical protein ACHAXT_007393 [Thalassiosira profunda]